MSESLKSKMIKGFIWSAIERFSVQGIQFLLTIIIARLVSPSDYGLIAMLSIFLAIAQTFIDSGFSNALIQKQDRTETDFSTVFYFNIAIGVITYTLLYYGSTYIASFYNELNLIALTKVVGLNLIINSFSVVQRAKLTIALDFKKQAIISLVAVILSGGVGVYMAYVGYGVWAIASQSLLNNFLYTLLLWLLVKWMPQLCFSWESFRKLFSFGGKLLLSGLLQTIYTNLYNIIIGKKFSSAELGYYNRAYTIAYFPSTTVSYVIMRVIYPVLCSIQDDDEKLRSSFIQCIRMAGFVIFPLLTMLFVLAKPLVLLFLTDKWLPIVPLLQVMCIAYMLVPIIDMNNNFILAKGHTNYFFKAEITKKIVAVLILIMTVPFGVQVMCYGLILYSLCDMYIISIYTHKVVNCSFLTQVQSLLSLLILNSLLGGGVYGITMLIDNNTLTLFTGIICGGVLYIGFAHLFKLPEIQILKTILRR